MRQFNYTQPGFSLLDVQKSIYFHNLITKVFTGRFTYFRFSGLNLTLAQLVCDRLGSQPKIKHRGVGAYFQLPRYKGQVENWSWHNVCHQFALHFNFGLRLSVISDTFRCQFIDGIYIFDKLARSAAPGPPAAEIYSCGSRVSLNLEFTSQMLSKGTDGEQPWLSGWRFYIYWTLLYCH